MFIKLHKLTDSEKVGGDLIFINLNSISKVEPCFARENHARVHKFGYADEVFESVPEVMELIANAEKRQCDK